MPEVSQPGLMPPGVKRYRSVFGVVDAIQLTARNCASVYEWADAGPIFARTASDQPEGQAPRVIGLTIFTAAGRMRAAFGDWVVRERNGRFFPYKPTLFEELFAEVRDV